MVVVMMLELSGASLPGDSDDSGVNISGKVLYILASAKRLVVQIDRTNLETVCVERCICCIMFCKFQTLFVRIRVVVYKSMTNLRDVGEAVTACQCKLVRSNSQIDLTSDHWRTYSWGCEMQQCTLERRIARCTCEPQTTRGK